MGWSTDLQQASFRGVEFECISTKDAVAKSLAVRQSPYSNNAEVEDLGNEPRRISLHIILADDDNTDDYKLFLDSLETALAMTGSGELVHPVYGIMQVTVVNYEVQHDANELVDGCYVDVDFIEHKSKKKQLFIPVRLPTKVDYATVIVGPAAALQQHLEQLQVNDPNAFFTLINRVRSGLQSARRILGIVRSTVDNILSPPDWAVGLVDDVSHLVTFDVTNISALSKWRGLVNDIHRIGNVFNDDNSHNDPEQLKQLWRAVTTASVVSIAQAVVDHVRTEMASNSTSISLTPPELAAIRQQARTDIQTTITIERSISQDTAASANIDTALQITSYKTVADQVHQTIEALIETRPPITTELVMLPCTSHWLAHQLYGDMSRADELKRLNPALENPALLLVGMELSAYAR